MKTNDQKARPAVVLLCGVLVVGTLLILSLAPKLRLAAPSVESETATPVGDTNPQEEVMAAVPPPTAGRPPGNWGIEVVGLYPAVRGRVLDLRYKILDTAKAALLPNEPGGIYLIDESTGVTTKLPNSPKTGSIPQNPQKLQAGRTYSFSFPNQGNLLKSGSKVTLVIGSFRAENLAVQ